MQTIGTTFRASVVKHWQMTNLQLGSYKSCFCSENSDFLLKLCIIFTDMQQITDITYRPICIGRNDYRYRYIGFADIGYNGRYFISADTDMPTLHRRFTQQVQTSCGSDLLWLGPKKIGFSCVRTSCCLDLLWLGPPVSGPTVAWTSCVRNYCGSDLLYPDLLWLGPPVSEPTVARTYCGLDLLWLNLLCPDLLWPKPPVSEPTVARTYCGWTYCVRTSCEPQVRVITAHQISSHTQEVQMSHYNSIDHFLDTEGSKLIHLVIAGNADCRKYKNSFTVGLGGHGRSLVLGSKHGLTC